MHLYICIPSGKGGTPGGTGLRESPIEFHAVATGIPFVNSDEGVGRNVHVIADC